MQYALNLKWQVTAWDKALELVSGFARHEVLGRNFVEELVVSEDQHAVLEVLGHIRHSKKEVHDFAFVLYSKSGSQIKLLLDVFPYFDETKSVDGISIIAKGASQHEEGVSFDLLHFALNSKWQVTAWNDALQSVTDFERDEIVGRHFPDFVVQEDQGALQHVLNQAYQQEEDVHNVRFTLYSKSGIPNRLRLNMSLYFNESGSVTGVSISAKRASEAWAESRAYFDDTVEAAIQQLEDDAFSKKKRFKSSHSSATTTATSLDELPEPTLGSLPSLSGSPTLDELPLGCDVS